MNILVLNCGSSSLKFQLIAADSERIEQNTDVRLAHGIIERLGGAAIITLTVEGETSQRSASPIKDGQTGGKLRNCPTRLFFLDLIFLFCIYTLAVLCYFLLQTTILVKISADYFRFYPFSEIILR